jgi:transposase-like protein
MLLRAKFWLQVVTELKNRGVTDIFIACVDGLKGFPEAIGALYPQTAVQQCLVHMVRHSLNYVSWKMRKVVAADLKTIYSSATADEAVLRLQEFEEKWGADYPTIVKSWRSNCERLVPLFEYPLEIRRRGRPLYRNVQPSGHNPREYHCSCNFNSFERLIPLYSWAGCFRSTTRSYRSWPLEPNSPPSQRLPQHWKFAELAFFWAHASPASTSARR